MAPGSGFLVPSHMRKGLYTSFTGAVRPCCGGQCHLRHRCALGWVWAFLAMGCEPQPPAPLSLAFFVECFGDTYYNIITEPKQLWTENFVLFLTFLFPDRWTLTTGMIINRKNQVILPLHKILQFFLLAWVSKSSFSSQESTVLSSYSILQNNSLLEKGNKLILFWVPIMCWSHCSLRLFIIYMTLGGDWNVKVYLWAEECQHTLMCPLIYLI